MHLLDSSVWIDYFTGAPWTRQVASIVQSSEPIFLSVVNLVEIYSKYLLRSESEAEKIKRILLSRCRIIEVNQDIALQASALKAKHTMAIADAMILATARSQGVSLLTYDSDFQGLKGVRVLKRR
ncbi:type II toxin-antitoxin system VapC family toxin [Candidatus Micrarchaeota archaeon]|nr:type II toxin-antitoxin system VapC family toxin [Candidatus Micrarchaeota archaeon]